MQFIILIILTKQRLNQTSRLKYQCPKCTLWFETPEYLRRHDDHHHTKHRLVACSDPRCGQTFFSVNDSKTHYSRSHSRLLKITCSECSASFSHDYLLLQHQKRATHPLSASTHSVGTTTLGLENHPLTVEKLSQNVSMQVWCKHRVCYCVNTGFVMVQQGLLLCKFAYCCYCVDLIQAYECPN